MWVGVIGNHLLGPVELPTRINSRNFLEFLQNELDSLFEDIPLSSRRTMWLQLDGAPAHYGRGVRDFLNHRFPNRWIGRGGPVPWPPRSPDLNPIDFYVWGYLKCLVYRNEITSLANLKSAIFTSAEIVRRKLRSSKIKRSLLRRSRECIDNDGGHFEHFL